MSKPLAFDFFGALSFMENSYRLTVLLGKSMYRDISLRLLRSAFLGILLVALGSLGGCIMLPAKEEALPSWVLNPPRDNSTKIHAVGEGASLRDATDNALAMIAGKISTNIQAETSLQTRLSGGVESSTVRNNIRTSTEALKLSDYEILKSAVQSQARFVLLALDRQNLINSITKQLTTLDQTIQGRLITNANQPLRRLYSINMMRVELAEGLQLTSLIEGLGTTFDTRIYRERYNGLLKEREKLEQTVRLGITTDQNTLMLKNNVVKLLLEQGIQVEPHRAGQRYDGILRVASTARRAEIFDEKHVELSVELKLVDDKGNAVSQAQFKAGASSLTNYDEAIRSANRLISEDVEAMGVWSALNMRG